MPENPYTRTARVTVTEYVPDPNMLPRCEGWKLDGGQCKNHAKYEMQVGEQKRPMCAVHIKPGAMFMPISELS